MSFNKSKVLSMWLAKNLDSLEFSVIELGQERIRAGCPCIGLALQIAYHNLKRYDRAIADYNEAICLDPNHSMSYNNRGNSYAGLKMYERSIADYDEAIRIEPSNANAYNNRGTTYIDIKNYQKGCADVEKACDLGVCKSYEYTKGKKLCK